MRPSRSCYRQVDDVHGGLDFLVHAVAFASRDAISAPFLETSRADFAQSLDISAYSLVALARGAAPLMERRGGGQRPDAHLLGSERVFPHYNVMGVAKAALEATVRYLANDLGPRGVRVNAISAGPIKTLAASGIPEFSRIFSTTGRVRRSAAPSMRTRWPPPPVSCSDGRARRHR